MSKTPVVLGKSKLMGRCHKVWPSESKKDYPMETDRFPSIPAEECHAASRSVRYMSSHLLADF